MPKKTRIWISIGVVCAMILATAAALTYPGHRYGVYHGTGFKFLSKAAFGLSVMEIVALIDVDGDMRLTQDEIDAARRVRLSAHDADGDGALVLGEFAPVWHETIRPVTVRVFQLLDTDGDALVSDAEFDRALGGVVELFDRNADDVLSVADLRRSKR